MKPVNSILLVGAVNEGASPQNGEESKNQALCHHLGRMYDLKVVDTKDWKRDPRVMASLVWNILVPGYDRIILSASSASVHRLLRLMRPLRRKRARTVYMVIGGYLPKGVADGRYDRSSYEGISSIVVEGNSMREELLRQGITSPILVTPNFKDIGRTWGSPERFASGMTRFIFLSRISESKGIPLIFEALNDPRLKTRAQEFSVDFYGPVEDGYREKFESHLNKGGNTAYKGYLDIYNDTDRCYQTVSGYHAMLFPTVWMGEGFPGVVLDAYACGLPVIASDWNMNREVVVDGKTGTIIPPNDVKALSDAILDVLDRKEAWAEMSRNCQEEALKYDTAKVLERHLPVILEPNTQCT